MSFNNDGKLTPRDMDMLSRLGIPAEFIGRAGVERVTDREAREKFGIRGDGEMSGLVFPYVDPIDGRRKTIRLRRDKPEIENEKPRRKYISAYGDRRHLYFPPMTGPLLTDKSTPVVMVEAEKSALALAAFSVRRGRPLLAVACGGCWGWRGKTGVSTTRGGNRIDETGPLPDLALITWEAREALIAFDSNAASNPKVQQARFALAEDLRGRGAHVRVVEIPEVPNVNGPDDFIATQGDEAFVLLLDFARTPPDVASADAEKMLESLRCEPDRARRVESASQIVKTVANVGDPGYRRILEARTAKLLQWPTSTVRSQVKAEGARQQESAVKAKEAARKSYLRSLTIDPPELVSTLERFFGERAHLPPDAALVLAFFTLNTWTFDVFDTTPYLSLESATPACGKNTVLNILSMVCARPQMLASTSEAALFRTIDRYKPTVLLDEAESLAGRSERADCLRSIAQAGYKKGGAVPRCVGPNNDLQNFGVFCPKVFAAIGGLTGPLLSRCIVIHMEKAPVGQVRRSSRQHQLRRDSEPLREIIEAYAEQSPTVLTKLYDEEPDAGYWPQLQDREAELWGPLLTHARLIGPDCEARLLEVASRFSRGKLQIQAQDHNVALIVELLEALGQLSGPRFVPGDLVTLLSEQDGWGERMSSCRDDRARAAAIGRFLARFRLSSREHTKKGTSYIVKEAIAKLSAHVPDRSFTAVTSVTDDFQAVEKASAGDRVTDMMVPKKVTSVAGPAVSQHTAFRASVGPSGSKTGALDTADALDTPPQTSFVEGEI
jgi:hypothetical protein